MKMMTHFILLFIFMISQHVYALSVDVFTDSNHPIDIKMGHENKKIDVNYYNLDELNNTVYIINQNIKKYGSNETYVRKRLNKILKHFKPVLVHASKGIELTSTYHLKNIPATVFDKGAYTVYGEVSLNKSLKVYKKWLKRK